MECPNCGEAITETNTECPSCGESLKGSSSKNQESQEHLCARCGEELEFISTYKQWYCYNCQEYVDLPEPNFNDIQLDQVKKVDELEDEQNNLEITFNEDSEEDYDSTSDISWDEGDEDNNIDTDEIVNDEEDEISYDSPENEAQDAEADIEEEINDSEVESDEEDDTEFSWDDDTSDHDELEESNEDADLSAEPIRDNLEIEIPSNDEDEELEIDLEPDSSFSAEDLEISAETIETDESSIKDSSVLGQLHQAWLKVNNIQGLAPDDSRVNELEKKLKNALLGKLEPNDAIALANSSLKEVEKLEKELKDMIHKNVSDLFHFVNSKLFLAKKIGFTIDDLEEELDNISSLIARSEYHQAHGDLEALLTHVLELPKTHDEILIGMEKDSEIIKELLEPRAKKVNTLSD